MLVSQGVKITPYHEITRYRKSIPFLQEAKITTWKKTVWKKANDTKCVAYCFRHNYAITNINRILHRGVEGDEDLIALSRSMGHASLKATLHYYNITPQFGKILEETGENHFNDILPNIDNYED